MKPAIPQIPRELAEVLDLFAKLVKEHTEKIANINALALTNAQGQTKINGMIIDELEKIENRLQKLEEKIAALEADQNQ